MEPAGALTIPLFSAACDIPMFAGVQLFAAPEQLQMVIADHTTSGVSSLLNHYVPGDTASSSSRLAALGN